MSNTAENFKNEQDYNQIKALIDQYKRNKSSQQINSNRTAKTSKNKIFQNVIDHDYDETI